MNKFEMFMIGSKKIPNLEYTKGERAMAWFAAIIAISAGLVSITYGIVGIFMGEVALEAGMDGVFGHMIAGLIVFLLFYLVFYSNLMSSVIRQYKDAFSISER